MAVTRGGRLRENLCGQEEKGSVVGFKKEERDGGGPVWFSGGGHRAGRSCKGEIRRNG